MSRAYERRGYGPWDIIRRVRTSDAQREDMMQRICTRTPEDRAGFIAHTYRICRRNGATALNAWRAATGGWRERESANRWYAANAEFYARKDKEPPHVSPRVEYAGYSIPEYRRMSGGFNP